MTGSPHNPPAPGPRILAIETSSAVGSVALADGAVLRCSRRLQATQRHAQNLIPMVAALCEEQGWPPESLEHAYLSVGPGSFTGLRIAVAAVRSLTWSLDLRVVGVPTLAVVARNALRLDDPPPHLGVVLDAKRQQVYAALFALAGDRYETVLDATLLTPGELLDRAPRPLTLIGEGLRYHEPALGATDVHLLREDETWVPRAESVHRLGWELACAGRFTPAENLVPIYIRPPEAEEVWAARQEAARKEENR